MPKDNEPKKREQRQNNDNAGYPNIKGLLKHRPQIQILSPKYPQQPYTRFLQTTRSTP